MLRLSGQGDSKKPELKNHTSNSSSAKSSNPSTWSEPQIKPVGPHCTVSASSNRAELRFGHALCEDVALSNFGIPRPQLIPTCVCLYFYWLSFPLLPLRLLGLVTRKYGNSHPIKLQNIKKVKRIQVAFAPWVGIRFPGISVKVTDSVSQISKWELVSLKAGVICQWIFFQAEVHDGSISVKSLPCGWKQPDCVSMPFSAQRGPGDRICRSADAVGRWKRSSK